MLVPGAHSPSPAHAEPAIHVHSVLQRAVCVPQLPHASTSVVPGVHTPSPVQGSYCHWREASQKRVALPQRPHATVSLAPGVGHESSPQVPLSSGMQLSSQSASRACPAGQPSEVRTLEPGAQPPSPVQAPALSHSHDVLQRWVWVPQRPQAPARSAPGTHAPLSPVHGP